MGRKFSSSTGLVGCVAMTLVINHFGIGGDGGGTITVWRVYVKESFVEGGGDDGLGGRERERTVL